MASTTQATPGEIFKSCPIPEAPAKALGQSMDDIALLWQRSVLQRTVAYIENELYHIVCQSPVLQKDTTHHSCIGLFHRSEIVSGKLVGRGGFSDVLEIDCFILRDEISTELSEEEQTVRERFARNALDADGNARFVIKQLQERLFENPKDLQQAAADLAMEAKFMSVLGHPNILSLRGQPLGGIEALLDGELNGYFIITNRLEDTLDKRIDQWKRDDTSFETKIGYASELADALEYLHARRIIFRDLKPANIGFASDGSLQLFDFGLCRQLPASEISDEVFEMSSVGTRRYMAPETVISGKYNCKADVYSWSLILWEMLSLHIPYENCNVQDHIDKVCKGGHRPIISFSWPSSIRNLFRNSWIENVQERLSMREVSCHLEPILHTQQEMDFPESLTKRLESSEGSSCSLTLSPSSEDSDSSMSFYGDRSCNTFVQLTLSSNTSAQVWMKVFPSGG